MRFKADCSFLFGDTLAPNCMTALCLVPSGLRLNNFVAFILTGYLLSTRKIRNRMCSESENSLQFSFGLTTK